MSGRLRQYAWRFFPGLLAALTLGLLLELSILKPFEYVAYRVLFQLRGEQPWDDRLVIIAIDDPSLSELGWFPWPRQRYVDLVQRLTQARASLVVMDLIWSEPGPDDAALAAAMRQNGRVIIAQAWDVTGVILQPTRPLRDAAIATGHIYQQQDEDGFSRTIRPEVRGEPALGLVTAQAYSLIQESIPFPPLDHLLWINWMGSTETLQHYSFVEVVQGQVPTAALRDKIVLVGTTATGLSPLTTPFDINPPASGVHLQAAVIDNLLNQRFLTPLNSGWYLLIALVGGPGLSWAIVGWSTRRQLLAVTGLSAAWLILSVVLFQHQQWLPIAFPIVLVSTTALGVALVERLRENSLLQRQVAELWAYYHQDIVLPVGLRSSLAPLPDLAASPQTPIGRVAQLAAIADQLGRSQSTQAAIARSLSIGLVAADLDGTVWFCNPVASEQFAIQVRDRLIPARLPYPRSDDQWHADLRALIAGIPIPPQEFQQGDRWFEAKLEPLSYHRDRPWRPQQLDGFLMLFEDVSARKTVEQQLHQQLQDMQRLNLLKDEFLSTVSHELRAPLANIKMAVHMVRLAPTPEAREQYLRILSDECNRETALINDLLDLQRLEAGAKDLALDSFYLQDWLPPLVTPFFSRAASQQQTLTLDISPDLPLLTTDPASLERLVTELIHNACKYTPPHHAIAIQVVPTATHLRFTIRNSGVEIPAAERLKIFDKFYRIPSSDRWQQGGTGLGLTLAKKLVEHLGGQIQVDSGAGQTVFQVELPWARAEA